MITYKSGPDDVKAYMAAPKEGGPFPALIVIHEWWGLNDQIKGVADVWASRGYVAVAPDLYRGKVTTDPKVAMELLNTLPESRATSDLVALFSFLRTNAAVKSMPVASIGFCMGGRLSLLLATAEPNLAACVVCYGRPETDQAKLAKIQAPVLGIYGGADKGIPQESLDGFTQQMNGLKKPIQIKVFPTAGHGFLNQNNPAYNAETAKEAWSVIEPFVSKALSPRSK
jgi:carboxymethylenebutenolidase